MEGGSAGQECYQCAHIPREEVCTSPSDIANPQHLCRYNELLEMEDAIHCALLTLKESFDIGMTEHNVELAVCTVDGFRRLTKQQVISPVH